MKKQFTFGPQLSPDQDQLLMQSILTGMACSAIPMLLYSHPGEKNYNYLQNSALLSVVLLGVIFVLTKRKQTSVLLLVRKLATHPSEMSLPDWTAILRLVMFGDAIAIAFLIDFGSLGGVLPIGGVAAVGIFRALVALIRKGKSNP